MEGLDFISFSNNTNNQKESDDDDDNSEDYFESAPTLNINSVSSGHRNFSSSFQQQQKNNNDDSSDDVDEAKHDSSKNKTQQQQQQQQNFEYTETFREITCDVFRTADDSFPVHAMFHLTQPITVRGHCAVIGLSGQCLVQGYLLRQRAVIVPDLTSFATANNVCHVAVQPFPKTCRKQLNAELAKSWGASASKSKVSGAVAHLQHLAMGVEPGAEAEEDMNRLSEIESSFGKINWTWTRQVLDSWKQRFGRSSDLTVVLVIAKNVENASDLSSNSGDSAGNAFAKLPFFAPRMAPAPHFALLDKVLPELVTTPERLLLAETQGTADINNNSNNSATAQVLPPSVLLAGAVNCGKSTTARYLCNSLISLYNECLWLDLDLGQSEFAPPGSIGLYKVTQPLFTGNQYRGVECILCHYLGCTSMRDPVSMAKAIESICDKVVNELRKLPSSSSNRTRQREGTNNNNNSETDSPKPLPIIINTHGWVLSTGRRMTLEVLQRIRPNQVIHLFTPSCREKKWLVPASGIVSDPASGLNDQVVDQMKFGSNFSKSLSAESVLPAPTMMKSGGKLDSWNYTLHRYTHDRTFEKDAAGGRTSMWTRYFWNSLAVSNYDKKPTSVGLLLSSLLLQNPSSNKKQTNNNKQNQQQATSNKQQTQEEKDNTNMYRSGKVISIPFDRVRLIFGEEEQMPWQFRGRKSKLPIDQGNNKLTHTVKGEILDSISGALVGLGFSQEKSFEDNNDNDNDDETKKTFEISQLCCETFPPNVFGFGLVLCPTDSDSAVHNFTSIKVVVPGQVADAVEEFFFSPSTAATNNAGSKIHLIVGWQQFDSSWNHEMAKVALQQTQQQK